MRTIVPSTVLRYLSSKLTFSPQRKSLRVGRGAVGRCADLARSLHAADRGGGDTRFMDLHQPRHSLPLEQLQRLGVLRGGVRGSMI